MSNPRICISNLSIEVTRQCQLECSHCLRGDAEPINIQHKFIDELFSEIEYIDNLTITGGEPFLNMRAIRYITQFIKSKKVGVNSFYIATNGLLFEKNNTFVRKTLTELIDLWMAVYDKEMSIIEISKDKFHGYGCYISPDNYLYGLAFVNDRGETLNEYGIIPEGRGINFTEITQRAPLKYKREPEYSDDHIALTAKGGICWDCDMSYKNEDKYAIPIKQAIALMRKVIEEE